MVPPLADVLLRNHLKKVFCPNFCVGTSFQLLEILYYVCGLNLGPALNLNQNPIFEMASHIISNNLMVILGDNYNTFFYMFQYPFYIIIASGMGMVLL